MHFTVKKKLATFLKGNKEHLTPLISSRQSFPKDCQDFPLLLTQLTQKIVSGAIADRSKDFSSPHLCMHSHLCERVTT